MRFLGSLDSFGAGMEVSGLEGAGFLGVPVGVGEKREHRRGVVPEHPAPRFRHHEEFAEGEGAGVEPEDAGEFASEAIHFFASASGSIPAITVSA